MGSKQKEGLSKRQARREELRKKERQQRTIVISAVIIIGLAIVGFIIVPSVRTAMKPVEEFIRVTPMAYNTPMQGTTMGDPNAKVKIEIFEDYKCSACQSYTLYIEPDVIQQLVVPGDVYYVFHQYPFMDVTSPEKDSMRSANAAECAAEQNRFWDYKALLFTNLNHVVGEFNDQRLRSFAESLGLDLEQFDACYAESRYQSRIDEDLTLGTQMGLTGTPSIFINGQIITPGKVPTIDQIRQAVQAALAGN